MKIKHVRKSAEFAEILRNSGRIKENGLTVFYRRHFSPGSLSVGIIISKKVVPLATDRNYLRRVIYGTCGDIAFGFHEKTEIVVRMDSAITARGRKERYKKLKESLENALEKINKL